MKKIIIISLSVFVIVISLLKFSKGFIPLPVNFRHIVHTFFSPKDLYVPILTDKFLFGEQGETKRYFIKPKYLDIYEIGFIADKNDIDSKYKFKGKIKVEFFLKNRFLFENLITSMDQAWYAEKDMNHYKQISLLKFDMPLQGKYKDDISVKITVLEPDQELRQYHDSIKLYIGVSPSP